MNTKKRFYAMGHRAIAKFLKNEARRIIHREKEYIRSQIKPRVAMAGKLPYVKQNCASSLMYSRRVIRTSNEYLQMSEKKLNKMYWSDRFLTDLLL